MAELDVTVKQFFQLDSTIQTKDAVANFKGIAAQVTTATFNNSVNVALQGNVLSLDLAKTGAKGEPGADKARTIVDYIPCGGTVSAYDLVVINQLGKAIRADVFDVGHAAYKIGMSMNSGFDGDTIEVVTNGLAVNPNWKLTPALAVFVGINGNITQSPNAGNYLRHIGYAKSTTSVYVNPEQAILRL